jgi:hypothetical protein
MDSLRRLLEIGECTAEEARKELIPRGILEEDDMEELQKCAEANHDLEASIRGDRYTDHPMGIFAEYGDYDWTFDEFGVSF